MMTLPFRSPFDLLSHLIARDSIAENTLRRTETLSGWSLIPLLYASLQGRGLIKEYSEIRFKASRANAAVTLHVSSMTIGQIYVPFL